MKAVEILAASHDERDANYDALLRVLADVASGRIHPHRVEVDLQARTWKVQSQEESQTALKEAIRRGFEGNPVLGGRSNGHHFAQEQEAFEEQYRRTRERIARGARQVGPTGKNGESLHMGGAPGADAITIDDLRAQAEEAEREATDD